MTGGLTSAAAAARPTSSQTGSIIPQYPICGTGSTLRACVTEAQAARVPAAPNAFPVIIRKVSVSDGVSSPGTTDVSMPRKGNPTARV